MIEAGILTALALVIVFAKFPKTALRRILGYDVVADVLVTVGLGALFFGTYSGMMVAIVAGIILSVVLRVARRYIGYETWDKVTCEHCGAAHREWVAHEGSPLPFGTKRQAPRAKPEKDGAFQN